MPVHGNELDSFLYGTFVLKSNLRFISMFGLCPFDPYLPVMLRCVL